MRYIVVYKLFKYAVYDKELYKICYVTLNETKANQVATYLNNNPEEINPNREWVVATASRYISEDLLLNNGFEPFSVGINKIYFRKNIKG